jgi:hypothetical protein
VKNLIIHPQSLSQAFLQKVADNFNFQIFGVCLKMWEPHMSQTCGPQRPVNGSAFPFLNTKMEDVILNRLAAVILRIQSPLMFFLNLTWI